VNASESPLRAYLNKNENFANFYPDLGGIKVHFRGPVVALVVYSNFANSAKSKPAKPTHGCQWDVSDA
jgi:hypothetical protein